jgi:proteasomal ATPase-associated factor 1
VPDLGIEKRSIKFPRQIIRPPYQKEKPTSVSQFHKLKAELTKKAPLHINSIALSPQHDRLVAGGPDGFCAVVSASSSSTDGEGVLLKGHVGDVLDCKWFPSGQVCFLLLRQECLAENLGDPHCVFRFHDTDLCS